jgi:hypothetical protein
MKTNTTIGMVLLCVICVATLMGGCIDDIDSANEIQDSIVEMAIEKASEDVMYTITFEADPRNGLEACTLLLNNDGKVIVSTDDNIEFGNWELYREDRNGDLYDITYCGTELRVALRSDYKVTGWFYENGFTRCGEQFDGVWVLNPFAGKVDTTEPAPRSADKPASVVTPTPVELPDLPVTVSLEVDPIVFGSRDDKYLMVINLYANGIAEFSIVGSEEDGSQTGTWQQRQSHSTSKQYELIDCAPGEFLVTIRNDGTAFGSMMGFRFDGTWETGTKSTYVLEPRDHELEYTVINWLITASYFEYDEDGFYTGNSDGYYYSNEEEYSDSAWAAREPNTVADILKSMGVKFDKIVVTSEVVTQPSEDRYVVKGDYVVTGSRIGVIKLTATWAGHKY